MSNNLSNSLKFKLMNKAIFLLFMIVVSCNEPNLKNDNKIDSTLGLDEERFKDSLREETRSQSALSFIKSDTIGIINSPIKIIKSKIVENEYSTYRNVFLRYQNISKKTVTAIRFRWYGLNAFGEPAELGNLFVTGVGSGFTEDIIKPNGIKSSEWDVLSRDVKKIVIAYAYEVVFSDGTKWKTGR